MLYKIIEERRCGRRLGWAALCGKLRRAAAAGGAAPSHSLHLHAILRHRTTPFSRVHTVAPLPWPSPAVPDDIGALTNASR